MGCWVVEGGEGRGGEWGLGGQGGGRRKMNRARHGVAWLPRKRSRSHPASASGGRPVDDVAAGGDSILLRTGAASGPRTPAAVRVPDGSGGGGR